MSSPDPNDGGPIKVGFNARVLAGDSPAGVARYAREFVAAVGRCDPPLDVEFSLFGVEKVPSSLSDCGYVQSAGEPAPSSGLRAHLWEQFLLPLALRRHDIDVFHTPAGQPPAVASVPLVTTIHDISHIVHPEWFSRSYAALHGLLTPISVRRSDLLISVSRSTRGDLVDRYPRAAEKSVVVHNGVRKPGGTPEPVPELLDEDFVLFVGSSMPRKNLDRSLRAYRRYREATAEPVALALVGPDRSHFADAGAEGTSDGLPGVHPLGYVSDSHLAWLYESASALLYPSLHEGFGLPVLEAMSVGTPVVTSDRGATAEVAGDAAVLVDPECVSTIASGLEAALDPTTAERLAAAGREHAAGFTWERTARETVAVYRSVVEGDGTAGIPTAAPARQPPGRENGRE